ncbi:MAG: ATP-binding protein [Solobacterium sp.]|nr:ATP-binding protein [Solobacterium sp.]
MLLQFSVENYKSYKDRVVLSLEASSDKELPDNIVDISNNKLLKVAAIFGANASGKSNLFSALTSAIINIRFSNQLQIDQPLANITPFAFDEETKKKPSSFEFVFIQNGIKYVYGYSATPKEIVKEYLYAYKSAKATTIFDRDETRSEVYKFTVPSIKKELDPIVSKNTKNKLFLSTATQWNSTETREAFSFFAEKINTYDSDFESLIPRIGPLLRYDDDHSVENFVIKLLKAADINIEKYSLEVKEHSAEDLVNTLPVQLRNLFLSGIKQDSKSLEYIIHTLHTVNNNSYVLNMRDESEGTRNLFGLAPILKRAFKETGEIICIDEFDKSMHPALVQYLINLFNDPSVNVRNAQLIISTHDVSLLSLDHLRRDQFYFTDKDRKTGISELYSLDDFSPRKKENIRNAYLLGRYGAVPNLKEGIDLE